jgi:hypothetical protein
MDHQGTGPSRPSAGSRRQPAWTPRDGAGGAGVPEDDDEGLAPRQGGTQRTPGSFGYGPGGFDALDDGSAGTAGPSRDDTGGYRTRPGPGGPGTGAYPASGPGAQPGAGRGTGAYPAANQGTGAYTAAGRGTGAYPAANQGTGAYPAARQGTGANPAAGQGTGAHPSAGRGTGAYPAARQGTGAYPAVGQGTGAYPAAGQGTGAYPAAGAGTGAFAAPGRGTGAMPTSGRGTGAFPGSGSGTGPRPASGTGAWPASTPPFGDAAYPGATDDHGPAGNGGDGPPWESDEASTGVIDTSSFGNDEDATGSLGADPPATGSYRTGAFAADGSRTGPRRRSARGGSRLPFGGSPAVWIGTAVVIALIAGFAAWRFLYEPRVNAPVSPTLRLPTSAASSPGFDKSLGKWQHIGSRSQDPEALTIAALFPPQFELNGVSYTRTAAALTKDCETAVYGGDLQAALQSGSCNQVVRASYLTNDGTMMGTIGVVNLSSSSAAQKAGDATGSQEIVAPLAAQKGPTSKLGKGSGVVQAEIKGHYLILMWAEYSDLKTPSSTAQREALEQFATNLVTGTANINLSTRMLTGKP